MLLSVVLTEGHWPLYFLFWCVGLLPPIPDFSYLHCRAHNPPSSEVTGPWCCGCRCLTFGSSCWHVLEWKLSVWWSSPVVRNCGERRVGQELWGLDLVTPGQSSEGTAGLAPYSQWVCSLPYFSQVLQSWALLTTLLTLAMSEQREVVCI